MTIRTTQDALAAPDMADILVTLGSFLSWAAEDNALYGGYHADDALNALQQLLGWDDVKMAKFVEVFVEKD